MNIYEYLIYNYGYTLRTMNLYKRGNIWWCKFRVDNILYQYSCKTKDKSVATEVAAALNADTVRKKFDIPAKYKTKKSFKDAWEEYIKYNAGSPGTRKDKISLSKHFQQVFQKKDVSIIDRHDIINYQAARLKEVINSPKNMDKRESEISFRSVNYEIAILSHFFNYCIERGISR